VTPEEAKALHTLAWFAYIGIWGKGKQHRWRLAKLGRWMDELQTATGLLGDAWYDHAKTIPGFMDYWKTPTSWRQHRGPKERHSEE